MSESILYRDLLLKKNPFDPPNAEGRSPDEIFIVGEGFRSLLNSIYTRIIQLKDIEDPSKKTLGYVLLGSWGSGKTAMIKKTIGYIEKELGDKAYTLWLRIPQSDLFTFFATLERAIEKRYRVVNKPLVEPEEDISLSDVRNLSESIKNLVENISADFDVVIISLDQLENISFGDIENKDEEINIFSRFLRDLLDLKSKKGAIVVIVASTAIAWESIFSGREKLLRRYISERLDERGMLTLNDVKILFKELLKHCRTREVDNPFHPFTEAAVEEIYYQCGPSPGIIFREARDIIEEAARYGITIIDEHFVRTRTYGLVAQQWVKELETKYISLRMILDTILEFSRCIEIIRSYISTGDIPRQKCIEILSKILGIKSEELEEFLQGRPIDYIVHYVSSDGRPCVSIIKIAEKRIDSKMTSSLRDLLSKATIHLPGYGVVNPEQIFVVAISGQIITKPAKVDLRSLEFLRGIRVYIRTIETSQPYDYGKIKYLYRKISESMNRYIRMEDYPEALLEFLRKLTIDVLKSLRIII